MYDGFLCKDLPLELLQKAISLDALGTPEVGWKYKDAKEVIGHVYRSNYAILGGDVYELHQDTATPTSCSWYPDTEGLDWDVYVEKSRQKAVEYLDMFYQRNGDAYCYVIVAAPKGWQRK